MDDIKSGQNFLDGLPTPQNPFKSLLTMKITRSTVDKINDSKFAWLNLIVQGHMIVICAKPNGGKTTVMVHAAGEMSMAGYEVYYVNADASAVDIKDYAFHAIDFGYNLINPDLTDGSAEKVVDSLKEMTLLDADYTNSVLILDTLKKFSDMMSKNKGKEFYTVLRTLSAKGMTIICLAHTNKYDDKDGKPVFEGVGDLRSDFDELIYLIPVKNPDGSMTVSTSIDKCRAALKEQSFSISKDREVIVLADHIDTLSIAELQRHLHEDSEVIEFILEHIRYLAKSATELHDISKLDKVGFSRKRIDSVLKRYCVDACIEPKWLSMPALKYGTKYGLISDGYAAQLKGRVGV
jgi:predicted CoA-binding protein